MNGKKIRVFKSLSEWQAFRTSSFFSPAPTSSSASATLGFVPTMGALHEGHASLVKRSAHENQQTLVSIFVNPTQFNDPKDLAKYPRTLERDLEILTEAGADYVIYPTAEDMYRDGYRYRVSENELSLLLCGAHRPGHFDGVLTVVLKLLNLAQAQRAYFGEKDYQQLLLIQGMVKSSFLPVEIVPCPTLRETDGLAMSSRNTLLTPDERNQAPAFSRALKMPGTPQEIKHRLEAQGFRVDYVEEMFERRLGAVHLGKVRLIDNVALTEIRPQGDLS